MSSDLTAALQLLRDDLRIYCEKGLKDPAYREVSPGLILLRVESILKQHGGAA